MNTDKYFQHLLEADLSGDKALVAAWQRAASEIAAKKRNKLMGSLAEKVKQHARPALKAVKKVAPSASEHPWYIRAGQSLGLLTKESTEMCYANIMEGTPETRRLGRKISKQFARIAEKTKRTGERGDYFIPHMLKLKAQRLAQQARHA